MHKEVESLAFMSRPRLANTPRSRRIAPLWWERTASTTASSRASESLPRPALPLLPTAHSMVDPSSAVRGQLGYIMLCHFSVLKLLVTGPQPRAEIIAACQHLKYSMPHKEGLPCAKSCGSCSRA